jgi:adenylate cyclase
MPVMSRLSPREALQAIDRILGRESRAPLEGAGRSELQALLERLATGAAPANAARYARHEATILFADLRGFAALAGRHPPEVVLAELNRCFGRMVELIAAHRGAVDKFIGDAIMAVFHADPALPGDHARQAVLCAIEMQLAMRELGRDARTMPALYMGIGISTGAIIAGVIGSDAYRAYTVVGEPVNLAARVETLSLRGQILMSEATFEQVKDVVHAGEPLEVHVKGRAERLRVREALGIRGLDKIVPRQDARKSPRVPLLMRVEYWPLEDKLVAAKPRRGRARDLGYYGMLAELPTAARLHAEVKLAFELPCVNYSASEVYARIVYLAAEGAHWLAGLEFTSITGEAEEQVRRCVQMLLQGDCGGAASSDEVPLGDAAP